MQACFHLVRFIPELKIRPWIWLYSQTEVFDWPSVQFDAIYGGNLLRKCPVTPAVILSSVILFCSPPTSSLPLSVVGREAPQECLPLPAAVARAEVR